MKLSLDPLDVKYDYSNDSIPLTTLQKAHSIYSTADVNTDWRDSVFYAKEEVKLSLDLLLRTKQDLKITELQRQEQDFDLKRLLYVKETDLNKVYGKFKDKIQEFQLEENRQKDWAQFIINMKKRNWTIVKKFRNFFLDFGFKKVGSNLDFQVLIQNSFVNLDAYYPIRLVMGGKVSSKFSELKSADFEFMEIELGNFSVFDQEISEIITRGDLEEEFKNLKKGNGWILKGFRVLQVGTEMTGLQEDKELDVLVLLLRYMMLKVYKRNFRNRGVINCDYKSAA
jgi:hypothetical protein